MFNYDEGSDNHKEHPDPFLFTDSKIMAGEGKAVVCAVGANTLLARSRTPGDLKIEEQQTDLEKKLEKTAKQISKYAMLATFISVASHLVFLIVIIMFSDRSLFSNNTLLSILNICIIAVVLMIVAIPEGLPLAVSIAMALSISRLKEDEILIKNLESVQSCAMLHDICIGKTGTMTKGRMNVALYQIGDTMQTYKHERDTFPDAFMTKFELPQQMKQWVRDCILYNTDVHIETNEKEFTYEPQGQALEVGLIKFLLDNEEDIQHSFIQRNANCSILASLPFDQQLKRKTVIRRVEGQPDVVRIYVKGAPEWVIPLCNQTFDS